VPRRGYHDRIAALEARSREVVDSAVKGGRSATLALPGEDRPLVGELDSAADWMSSVVAGVDRPREIAGRVRFVAG
jgi:hypothetical protein